MLCFSLFKGLLVNEQKEHIKSFAAESFAFLIRKSKNHKEVINMLLSELHSSGEISEGVGLLIFHSIKGVKEQFHSNGGNILCYSLNGLLDVGSNSEQVSNRLFISFTTDIICSMCCLLFELFFGMFHRRKAISLISSRDHCQRSSPSRISDTPRAGFEPTQDLS